MSLGRSYWGAVDGGAFRAPQGEALIRAGQLHPQPPAWLQRAIREGRRQKERTLTHLDSSYWGLADSSLQSISRRSLGQRSSGLPRATHLFAEGLKRWEMRNHRRGFRGNHGPSSHRGEDPYLIQRQLAIQITYSQQSVMAPNVRSVYSSSSVFVSLLQKLEWLTRGFKATDKLQLSSAQADRSFMRQTLPRRWSRLTPKESSFQFLLASPFLYFSYLPFGCALCK